MTRSTVRPAGAVDPGHASSSDALAGRVAQLVDDPTVGEEHDPVGVGRGHRVVGDHDDGLAVVVDAAAEQLEHLGARAGVEVAGRLVGEDDLAAD